MKRFFLLKVRAGLRVDDRGVAAVEFAMIGLPLILLLFGILAGGRMLWTQNSLQYAVERAARYAVSCNPPTTPCPTTSQIQNYAANPSTGAYGQTISPSVFSVATPAGCGAQTTQVSVSLPYTPLFPFPNVTLTARSCRPT